MHVGSLNSYGCSDPSDVFCTWSRPDVSIRMTFEDPALAVFVGAPIGNWLRWISGAQVRSSDGPVLTHSFSCDMSCNSLVDTLIGYTVPVPEPSSLHLCFVAFAAFALTRRRNLALTRSRQYHFV